MKVRTLGIDLAKNTFQLHGVDEEGRVVVKKRLSRKKVLPFVANLESCLIGMEACGGAHYWARELARLGHDVRLMSPQFVKPYVKTNKNDYNDAEAICEAVGRANMRFVAVKSVEQQEVQALHRVRSQLVKSRTAQANQIRGLLAEYGIVIGKGLHHVRARLPEILEDGENGLTCRARRLFSQLYERLCELDCQVRVYDQELAEVFKTQVLTRRIGKVDGVGPLGATAMVAAVGDATAFANARQMAAWLGLVPRQRSTGDKRTLLGISKRGDCYLRSLLIHGARAVVRHAARKDDERSRWINSIRERRGSNVAAVAVANKNVRIIWALLTKDEDYRAAH